MADIAHVRSTPRGEADNAGSSDSVDFSVLPSQGNLIVVGISLWHNSVASTSGITNVQDNQGNGDYDQAIWQGNGIKSRQLIYYKRNIGAPSGTFTVTVNFSNASGNYARWSASEYANADTSAGVLEATDETVDNSGTGTTLSCTAAGTTGGMAFGVIGNADQGGSNTNIVNTTSHTERSVDQSQTVATAHQAVDKILSSTGTHTCTWTYNAQVTSAITGVLATFKSASVTAAVTGTATASITEADIVAGGKTVILTLTGDTWVAAAGTPAYSTGTTKGTTAADGAGGGGGRTGNGTLTCTFPSGYTPTAGHFALMILYHDQGTGSTPTDWTQVSGSPWGSGTPKLQAFYKILAGGESAPATTISGSGTNISHCANMAIYTQVGSIGAVGTASDGTGTPMTAGAVTTTADNSIVACLCGRGDNEDSGSQTFGGSSTGVNERLDGGTGAGNDSQVSMYDKVITTSGSSSGSGSSTTSATDPWVSVQIELKPTTPFADQRAAIRNGLDSAQSEAGGWDAKVKGNIPVANVVRTSNTVCTITLQAQADYNITAQETITATIPAAALTGAAQIVATPAFTVDFVATNDMLRPPMFTGYRAAAFPYWRQ